MNLHFLPAPLSAAIGLAASSQAAIVVYHEAGGAFLSSWGSTGNLVGGPLDGMNISEIPAAQFFGAENNDFRILDASGLDQHFLIIPGTDNGNDYMAGGGGITLTGGALDGQSLKNGHWLGATDDFNYYADGTGGVVRYLDAYGHPLNFDAAWTRFTGGELGGHPVEPGAGLIDFGGGNAMSNNHYVIVDARGTLEYYDLDTGLYSAEESEGAHGNWTTFWAGGPLDGLTLSGLQAHPEGSINGISYRFMGTSQGGMYFDIGTVPEPSSALMISAAAAVAATGRRRRSSSSSSG